MSKYVKRIECCYCGASSLINLSNPREMALTCSGCAARMSVDKISLLAPMPNKPTREIRFDPPPREPREFKRSKRDDDDDKKYDKRRSSEHKRGRRRRTFLNKLEDIWDEIEDIFD